MLRNFIERVECSLPFLADHIRPSLENRQARDFLSALVAIHNNGRVLGGVSDEISRFELSAARFGLSIPTMIQSITLEVSSTNVTLEEADKGFALFRRYIQLRLDNQHGWLEGKWLPAIDDLEKSPLDSARVKKVIDVLENPVAGNGKAT